MGKGNFLVFQHKEDRDLLVYSSGIDSFEEYVQKNPFEISDFLLVDVCLNAPPGAVHVFPGLYVSHTNFIT